jgi:hypothetical protein
LTAWQPSATVRRAVGQAVFLYIPTDVGNSLFCRESLLAAPVGQRTAGRLVLAAVLAMAGAVLTWASQLQQAVEYSWIGARHVYYLCPA